MVNLIRAVFALFWLFAAGFLGFLAYTVMQTESDPQMLWGWLVMCALAFLSATFLTYAVIFGHHERANAPHHHTHLKNKG
ncbi:MAG: hypothetical protein AAB359_09300 [Elusimicrobiota bacterium]